MKRRGLLDSTLVLWGGEFGRSPEAQGGKGRDHHNLGFSMWLAGGGIKGGTVVGATDAIGLRAVQDPYHVRDVHTTVLHQLGLDQDELTLPAPGPTRTTHAGGGEGHRTNRVTNALSTSSRTACSPGQLVGTGAALAREEDEARPFVPGLAGYSGQMGNEWP